ncbi:MAG: protein kinase, partial [Myxococcales bacterium]|nr:protein kinase [Myxococcales bacterium]
MLEVVPESLGAGALVARRYRLRHVLGQGGMGVVWAADEEPSGRPVALKLLHGESAKDPKSHERFLREARAALTITHPNVARVHEVGETDSGTPFIVMDRLVGESLRARLATWGRLPVGDCAWIARGIVAAVGAAHRVAIVHRDLKPENVFLVPAGSPRPHVLVLDFGIAKSMLPDAGAPSLTSTGTILGTPYYMAPEQIYGDVDVDARADVWALGVLIYECLYGQRPTEAAGVGQILKLITNDQIVPLARAAPHLPAEITALVDRMLSRHREGRPSLAEVEAVLARLDPGPAGTMATPLAPTLAPRSAPMAPTVPQAPPSGLGAPTAPGPTPNLVVPATAALARPSASPPTPQGPHPTLGASPPPTAGGSKAPLALAVAAGALALLGAASLAG